MSKYLSRMTHRKFARYRKLDDLHSLTHSLPHSLTALWRCADKVRDVKPTLSSIRGCFKGQGEAVNSRRAETEPAGKPRRAYTISLCVLPSPWIRRRVVDRVLREAETWLICGAGTDDRLIRPSACRREFIQSEREKRGEIRRAGQSGIRPSLTLTN